MTTGLLPTNVYVDETTHRLLVNAVISGSVATGGLTDAQLRATAVPVSGTFYQATQPVSNAGITTIAGAVSGTEMQVDVLTMPSTAVTNAGLTALNGAITGTEVQVDVLTMPSTAVTGAFYQATQPVSLTSTTVTGTVAVTQSGTWDEVGINDSGNSITVDGTFWQATQPVSGTFYQATQPVSGTVTANLSATDNTVLDNIDTSTASKYITGIGHGVTVVTTAGTDVALAGSTACKRVTIQAQTDNTGVIAVGGSGVDFTIATGTGIILYAGDAYELDIDNLADVFIDASINGDGVRYSYFV